MDHPEVWGRLNDLVDGALPPAEREPLLEHLEGCAACRAELEGLRALRAATEALPREIAPPRDLWPQIAARLGEREGRAGAAGATVVAVDFRAGSRRRGWTRWAPLAAAAVLLVVLSSGITAHLMRARGAAPLAAVRVSDPPASARPLSALVAFRPTEIEYLGTVEALQAELDTHRDELAPQTVAIIEENLRIIDQAIAEARAALERDPSNADLPILLSGVYRRKVDLLQSALQLRARSL